jgi:hypothetical protein
VPTYDRSGLIRESIDTLRRTLIEEMVVVAIIIFLFLLHVRSALVPILTLPTGRAARVHPMGYQGLTANIMSLGGIAVAIGAMVDASIILIENVHKRLEEAGDGLDGQARRSVIVSAMQEVGPSLFFSLLIITVAFVPVFTLEGTEGRLFKPLAFTKTYSMGFAAVLAVTLTPALAALLIRGKIRGEHANPINRLLVSLYIPVVRWVGDVPEDRRHRCAADDGPDGAGVLPPGQRVHAAARRGRDSVHADGAAGNVDRRGRTGGRRHGSHPADLSGGRERVRQDRARGDGHRPGTARDGRDDDRAQAALRVAARA